MATWQMCDMRLPSIIVRDLLGRVPMTSYNARAAAIDERAATVGIEQAHVVSPTAPAPTSRLGVRAYERFLKMPMSVVLALLWLVGAASLGSCALVLYAVGSMLLRSMA